MPVGQVLPIRDREDRVRGELYVLAYTQTAGSARFTMTGWIERSFGTGPSIPPPHIRRQRIDLDLRIPAPEITVTQRAVSPAELLLDVIAAQLLTLAATFPQDTPEELAAAQPGLVPHPAAGLGDIIAVLQAADALSPASPAPGQLAGLGAWASAATASPRRPTGTCPNHGGAC